MKTPQPDELQQIFNPVQLDELEIPQWWVKKANAGITQLRLQDRIDENRNTLKFVRIENMDSLDDSMTSFLDNRIAELEALKTSEANDE